MKMHAMHWPNAAKLVDDLHWEYPGYLRLAVNDRLSVWCTPFHDGIEGIPVEVSDDDGGDIVYTEVLPLEVEDLSRDPFTDGLLVKSMVLTWLVKKLLSDG